MYNISVDNRELNKITVKDNFSVSLIDDQIEQLNDKQYFTIPDLKNGFRHIKINKESISFTSFIAHL